ncbi:hypothetical protein D3C80_2033950 [compost metagenome]
MVISPLISFAPSPSGAAVAAVPAPLFPALVAAALSALLFDEQPANKPAISVNAAKPVIAFVFFIVKTPLSIQTS